MSGYVYAAYNAAPPTLARDQGQERDWYAILRGERLIRGLELSFSGGLHPRGVVHLATLLDPGWQNVVTNIPGTIAALAGDSGYGLASTTDAGRAAAVDHVRCLHAGVRELRDTFGANAVIAVELHSAPLATASSPDALALSLTEIAAWDWKDVRLVVEHADALVDDHAPQKGWLPLEAETDAVLVASERSGRSIGQGINWGRSAIETRSADGPVRHLGQLRDAGTLASFTVSGSSGHATARSEPWGDVHLALDSFEPESLLTAHELTESLAAIGAPELDFLGVKVGRAADATTLEGRLGPGLGTLHEVDRLKGTQ